MSQPAPGASEPAQPAIRPSLHQLYFYLTAGCNLACRHCWLAPKYDPDGSHYPTLPLDLFELALYEAKPLGLKGVKLTGAFWEELQRLLAA